MSRVNNAVQWAIAIANDNSHGYSQANRHGCPDYDCSSLTIAAFEWAGIPVGNASFTGNMYSEFMRNGWKDVTSQVNFSNGYGLIAGDVLLNHECHTCIYIGNGKVVNARTDTDGRSGDSHGDEIRIQSYWNFPWDCVLRYPENATGNASDSVCECGNVISQEIPKVSQRTLKNGSVGWEVTALQALLNYYGADLDADGEFGRLTQQALIKWQKENRDSDGEQLNADGVCGEKTWRSLL